MKLEEVLKIIISVIAGTMAGQILYRNIDNDLIVISDN